MRRAKHQGVRQAAGPGKQSGTQLRSAARVYALLLRLYPRAHRQAFGQQMLQTFQDHYRDIHETRQESALWYWHDVLGDVGRSLVREYWMTMRMAMREGTGSMRTGGAVALTVVAALLLLLGMRVWLSPALLSAPHGGGSALSSVVGLALLVLVYGLVAFGLLHALQGTTGPARPVSASALQRATLIGILLGCGALLAITVETLGSFDSPLSLAVWGLVVVAAPVSWGVAGLLAARAGGSWRLAVMVAVWSGMVSALVGAVGEVASTLLALPRMAQAELANPDYLAWHQPDVQSYAIASAMAVGIIGLILAPVVASIAGGIGSGIGKSSSTVALPGLPDEANLR